MSNNKTMTPKQAINKIKELLVDVDIQKISSFRACCSLLVIQVKFQTFEQLTVAKEILDRFPLWDTQTFKYKDGRDYLVLDVYPHQYAKKPTDPLHFIRVIE